VYYAHKQRTAEMSDQASKPNIGIIIGSNRPTRICKTVAEWVFKEMQHEQLNLEIIDLAEVNLPFLDEPEIPAHHNYQNAHTKAWSEVVSKYDGFVLVFPQYNWGYPAVLKNALDYLYDEWAGKPVSIMCYGGHGGFQATLGMKLVTQGLRMYNMATNPPLDIEDEMFDESGQFKDIDAAFARYKQPMRAVSAEFADILVIKR
jgi:NAD(P)H-dependent FMN reductase